MSYSKNRFDHINQRIAQAIKKNSTEFTARKTVKLLAVSKRHPVENIRQLYALGQRDFAESYLQEALEKIHQTADLQIIWHFIGPIQSNKTREIAPNFNWVHSVDRLKIARRLSDQRAAELPPLNICLQVNIDLEKQKSGFTAAQLREQFGTIISLPQLHICGLMAIPKHRTDIHEQRMAFAKLRLLKDELNQRHNLCMDTLSMGMSGDLEAAIAEGATIVRIGTALFGKRE
jgi:pyridoxal phosphate enzyme (YggS family)